MTLTTISTGRVVSNLSAIMRRAHLEARFALQLVKARREPIAARLAVFARFLKAAWKAAKDEGATLLRHAAQEVESRAHLARRAAENVALAASFGSAEAIRNAIASEHMRERFDAVRIDRLQAALASIGA